MHSSKRHLEFCEVVLGTPSLKYQKTMLPSFLFFPPPQTEDLMKYCGQQRRDKIAVNPQKCLCTSCLTFDDSRGITDTKSIVTPGPWETESQHWKSLQGRHQIAGPCCFKLYKQGTIREHLALFQSTPHVRTGIGCCADPASVWSHGAFVRQAGGTTGWT